MNELKIKSRSALFCLLIFWILSLLVRWPLLNRPLAKHHEYNTAMVLMNIDTWRAAGGAGHFHYIPVLNYPEPGDRIPARAPAPNFDADGNALYFSFGAGWYLFPYTFYQLFQWPAKPVYLQMLNLLLHGLGAWLWWCWLNAPKRRNRLSTTAKLVSVLALLFLPGMLWYNGNGYVNTSLSIPLLILWLMAAEKWSKDQSPISYGLYVCISLLCVYTDWFVVFLCTAQALIESRQKKQRLVSTLSTLLVWLAPILLGILLILFQYSSYVGLADTLQALSGRFAERSVLEGSTGKGPLWISFLQHYLTLYLPLVILLFAAGFQNLRNTLWKDPFFIAYGCALALYHLVFFQWSAVHEFAMLADALWLVYGIGILIPTMSRPRLISTALLFLACCLAQFYWINRPGEKARDGMPYSRYETFGAALQTLPKTAVLFMDPAWTAELQYHAGRSIQPVADEASARQRMVDWKITEAYWIEHDRYQIRTIKRLSP